MKKILLSLTVAAALTGTLLFANNLRAKSEVLPLNPKISPSVYTLLDQRGVNKAGIPILVILKQQTDFSSVLSIASKEEKGRQVYSMLTSQATESQKDLRAFLDQNSIKYKPFWITNMVVLDTANAKLIQTLAARSDVAKIVGNPAVHQKPLPMDGMLENLRTLRNRAGDNIVATNATQVWSEFGTRGKGIVVAGQDTGVEYTHPALVRQYRGNSGRGSFNHDYNWHDSFKAALPETTSNKCGYNLASPCDDDQHGSHTMGTMVGEDTVGNTVGMAPEAQWMACRNMDAGTGTPSSYIECFQFFLAPTPVAGDAFKDGDPAKAPHVINNSWGCTPNEGCDGSEMIPVLKAMEAAGIFVVVSAGNDGPDCSTIQDQPASVSDSTLSVGAYNHRSNSMAKFSSRGPSKLDGGVGPDIVAPGVSIRSSVPGGGYSQSMWSGTSMAGPHVAGEVALLWSAVPGLIGHIKETTDIIRSTAKAIPVKESCGGVTGATIPNNTSGYGFIDAYAAVKKAKAKFQ